MRFGQLVCASSQNIGDDVQSIAAARLLPRVDVYVDRERLDAVEGPEPVCTIMNAWFMDTHCWPPSPYVNPIFVGFHLTRKAEALIAGNAQYLKRFEPIGTRDRGTAEFLASLGVRAEVTYCLSLTFPRRAKEPANGKVMIVDADDVYIPRVLRRRAVRVSHKVRIMRDATKLQYARDLIEYYRDTASLVITTRLHCALPCIGMGIPTVFFGDPTDYRTAVVTDLGGTIYPDGIMRRKTLVGRTAGKIWNRVDWAPKPLDVSPAKERLLKAVSARMKLLRTTA